MPPVCVYSVFFCPEYVPAGELCPFYLNMITEHLHFTFGSFKTAAHITAELPGIAEIANDFGGNFFKPLLICDRNTEALAARIAGFGDNGLGGAPIPLCVLEPGEQHKNWQSVEAILRSARDAGLGRDGTFIGVGGGVIGDLSAFAASIYMRGCSLALVSTTLLGMVDASLGGKTGFDLFEIKNIAGTFFPASHVYMPLESLASLPLPEWKSGMAELIKTAILDSDDFLDEIAAIGAAFPAGSFTGAFPPDFASRMLSADRERLSRCIIQAAKFKGGIVEEDPLETGVRRVLLNLGHTFGHALESTAGLGSISHGEAVAWGIARACDLGLSLGICPQQRAEKIKALLAAYGYATSPALMDNRDAFMRALGSDKKRRGENVTFIVPDEKSARPVSVNAASLADTIGAILTR